MGLVIPRKKRKDVLDQISRFFMSKLENATLDEFIFLISWIGGTYVAYEIAKKTLGVVKVTQIGQYRQMPVPEHLQAQLGKTITVPDVAPLLADPHLLGISMVASYKFLKSDVGSIGSILNLLG